MLKYIAISPISENKWLLRAKKATYRAGRNTQTRNHTASIDMPILTAANFNLPSAMRLFNLEFMFCHRVRVFISTASLRVSLLILPKFFAFQEQMCAEVRFMVRYA